MRLLRETPSDSEDVEWLYDLAFAPGRRALSSYQLRRGVAPVAPLCRIARDDFGGLAGAIRYWEVAVGGAPALLLGPVAVHPTRQGEGIGGLLIGDSLGEARREGWTRVILVGDEPYYRRFGFTRSEAADVRFPPPTNPERVLATALEPDAWAGIRGVVSKPDA